MLTACVRRIQLGSASAVGSRGVGEKVAMKQQNMSKYGQSLVQNKSIKSWKAVATRQYATTESGFGADTKKWNVELNRLFKLRYYDDVTKVYAKMKESGAAPDATTYMIVFDSHIANLDNNSVVDLLTEAKNNGVKTSFLEKDEQLKQIVTNWDQSPEAELKSIQLRTFLHKFRQAGLNPFDPAH